MRDFSRLFTARSPYDKHGSGILHVTPAPVKDDDPMTHSPGDTPRPGRPSLLLAVIGLWLMVFGTSLEAAERPLPDTIQPGVTYLRQVVDNAGATTIDHRKLAPLVDFILQDKAAGELYFSTSDRLLDPLVYHEFELQQSLATILQYAFHPDIPSHVLALSSIRCAYWKEVDGRPQPFPDKWYAQAIENGPYLEQLTRPQLEAMVFLDYMKEALGRDTAQASELAMGQDGPEGGTP